MTTTDDDYAADVAEPDAACEGGRDVQHPTWAPGVTSMAKNPFLYGEKPHSAIFEIDSAVCA